MGTAFIPRSLRVAIGVALVGLMVGYTISAAASTVVADQGWFSANGEPAQARSYMVALLQRESDRLTQLRPRQDVVSQALAEKASQQSGQQSKPLSLTYLGGGSHGGLSVQLYAVEVRANDGTDHLFSLALTLLGGRVILTR